MKWVIISAALFVAGMLTFYTWASFDETGWQNRYYIWDKGKDVMVWLAFYQLVNKPNRKIPLFVLIFTIIRFVWELIVITTGIYYNNPLAVNFMFSLMAAGIIGLILKEWRRLKS